MKLESPDTTTGTTSPERIVMPDKRVAVSGPQLFVTDRLFYSTRGELNLTRDRSQQRRYSWLYEDLLS